MVRRHRSRRFVVALLLAGCVQTFFARDVLAGHLRGVSLSWISTANAGQVEFRFQYSGRWSALGTPPLGTMHREALDFGDGTIGVAIGPITSINAAENWFVADLRVTHGYAGPGPYTASYSNASRISGVRNAAPAMRLETIVRPASGNSSPASGSPSPIISVTPGSQPAFIVSASDVNADSLRFRLSNAEESGISAPPPGLSIGAASGQVTWDTSALPAGSLYSVQFTVEDLDASGNVQSKMPIDLTLRISRGGGLPPTISINPAGPYSVLPGTPITFTVVGTDADPGDTVTLESGNLPAGATMTPPLSGALTSPASSTFHWTPAANQGGSYSLTFAATDSTFKRASATVSIVVESNQPPIVACPAPMAATVNTVAPVSIVVQDPNGDPLTVTWTVDGSVVRTDSVAGSSSPTTLTLAQSYGTPGTHTVSTAATDSRNVSAMCSTVVNVVKADQTITFDPIPDRAFGDPPFTPTASTSSHLPVFFTVISGPALVTNGNLVTILGPGLVTVRASQPGDATYNAAADVDRTFTVSKAPTTVLLTSSANPSFRRQPVTFVAAVAGPLNTAVPTGTITFQNVAGALSSLVALDGNGRAELTLNTLEIGEHAITATFSGDELFNRSASNTLVQSIPNRPPHVSLPPAFTIAEGAPPLALTAVADDDDEDPIAVTWSLVSGSGLLESAGTSASFSASNGPATAVVRVTVADQWGASASADTTIAVTNVAPSFGALALSATTIDENGTVTVAGTFWDPGLLDPHTLAVDWGDGTGTPSLTFTQTAPGTYTFAATHHYLDDGLTSAASDVYQVIVTASDDRDVATAAAALRVDNVAPAISSVTGPPDPMLLGSTATVVATFTDPGPLDTFTCTYNWNDGANTTSAGSNGACSASHTYAAPGIYSVSVVVADDDAGSASSVFNYIVVYSPEAGSINGGGWISSSAGALAANPTLTGRANVGFNVKYQGDVPVGQTEFHFQNGGLNFHSTGYSWLVVSDSTATYEGIGTINGSSEYGFLVAVVDGKLAGTNVDRVRIKIWHRSSGAIVYDDQPDAADNVDATTPLSGGSIVIHR